ncbi:MAG: phage head closure protein [Bacteroidales bacterium]|nr:phage head closure protein [Bacteroidales bacterium]
MLSKRVTLIHPKQVEGLTGMGTGFYKGPVVWAAVDWSRGTRALRQGEVEVYDTVMVRMRYRKDITRFTRLLYDKRFFVITTFNADVRANTIQITAQEIAKFDYDE